MRGVLAEEASTQVLEAVTVVSVMLAAVVFVVTVDLDPPPMGGARATVDRMARDVLAILHDTPVEGSTLGDNLLEVAVQECLQNDCARLESRVDRLLPEGAEWALYLSTSDGLYPVRADRTPPGEAVTARWLIEPNWSYQFLASAQSLYDPVRDPVVMYGLPVVSGNPLHQGGNGLRILVYGNDSEDNAVVVMQGAASTRAVDASTSPTPPATALTFRDGGAPVAALDARADTLLAPGVPSGSNATFRLRLEESAGGVVPERTLLTVQVPRGWRAWGAQVENGADWEVLSNATDENGSAILARLAHSVSSGAVDFVFNATYLGDVNDHYPFAASLSSGAYAQAHVLVRADEHVSPSPYEAPIVLASVPRPLGIGATTTWTLGAFSPDLVQVTRIEVVEDDGRSVFADVNGLSGGGFWASEGDRLVWTGSALLGLDAPLSLAFEVTSDVIDGHASDRPAFVPTVDLGEATGRLLTEVSPGLYRGVFLPEGDAYAGYDASTGAALYRTHEASSDAVYRTTALPGTSSYTVGHGLSLGSSVFGSSMTPARRVVAPRDTVEMGVEVQSAVYELAILGFEPTIETFVYPPWSGDDREPVANEVLFNATLSKGLATFLGSLDADHDGKPDRSDVGRYTYEVPIPGNWLYGPYMVEARLSWLETLSETVDGAPLTEKVLRTASVYDYFVVEPTQGTLPPAPIYDVHLVVWFDEWG